MPPTRPGEPTHSEKPQPIGSFPFMLLFTICVLCLIFILWRRAASLKTVVSHQLKTWTGQEGRIRLSVDEGPPAHEFLQDEELDDAEGVDEDDEPLAQRAARLAKPQGRSSPTPSVELSA